MALKRSTRFLFRLLPTRVYVPGMHNAVPKRLNWEQIEARPQREGKSVVKGTSKRIVVVKSPDPKVFEQAIFIVREDFLGRNGRADALREAQQVADDYIRNAVSAPKRSVFRKPAMYWCIGSLLMAGLCILAYWILSH